MYMSGDPIVDKVTELQTRYDLSRTSTMPLYKLSPEDEYALLQQLNKAKAELLAHRQVNPPSSKNFWSELNPSIKTGIYVSGGAILLLGILASFRKR